MGVSNLQVRYRFCNKIRGIDIQGYGAVRVSGQCFGPSGLGATMVPAARLRLGFNGVWGWILLVCGFLGFAAQGGGQPHGDHDGAFRPLRPTGQIVHVQLVHAMGAFRA